MCSIAGFIKLKNRRVTDTQEDDNYVINTALELTKECTVRGTDASGFAFVNKENKMVFFKKDIASDSAEFRNKFLAEMETHGVPEICIFHSRAQTKGDAKFEYNNHPIIAHDQSLALVHNGHISNDEDIKKVLEPAFASNAQVDSEAILRLIEQNWSKVSADNDKMLNAVKASTKELVGRFTCALISTEFPDKLTIFKHENPVFLCADLQNDILWFASTDKILESSVITPDIIWGFLIRDNKKDFVLNHLTDNRVITLTQLEGELDFQMENIEFKAYQSSGKISYMTSSVKPSTKANLPTSTHSNPHQYDEAFSRYGMD